MSVDGFKTEKLDQFTSMNCITSYTSYYIKIIEKFFGTRFEINSR